jgi:IS5 family transposase
VLKQHRQLSYQELASHQEDSGLFWGFCPAAVVMEPEGLGATQDNRRDPDGDLGADQPGPREPRKPKLERGGVVPLNSILTTALMHEPSDSSLLWDEVRVIARLLQEAQDLGAGSAVAWRDQQRAAKKRAREIRYTPGWPNGCSSIAS